MDKSKFIFFLGSLILVCLACSLSSTGPAKDIHYYRPDVSEFSDRPEKSGNNKKAKIIIVNIDKNTNHRNANQTPSNQGYHLFIFFNILSKYIDLDKHQILHPPAESMHLSFMNWNKPLVDHQENISSSPGNRLLFQVLQIITTSIIRS